VLVGSKKQKRWYGRWYEDVIKAGQVHRIRRQDFLGSLKDLPTKKLAQREMDSRLAEVNSLTYRARPIASFSEFADRWESAVLPQLKPSTAINYRSHLRRHLKPFFGSFPLRDIEPEMVQTFVSKLDVNPLTARHILNTFQSLWRSARSWGYVSTGVTEGIRLPSRILNERRHFSLEEMRNIIAVASEPYKTCFWLAAETGMRAGELCGLRWQDVDFEHSMVNIVQTAWWGNLQTPKTKGSSRRFSISGELTAHIYARLAAWHPNQQGLVFATRSGRAWQCRKPLRQLQEILKRLGLPNAGLHAFRHSQVTIAERCGVPLKTIQNRVGHGNAETTLLYSHAIGEDDRNFSGWLGLQLNPNHVQNPLISDANGRKLSIVRSEVIEKMG
jgi:integrase